MTQTRIHPAVSLVGDYDLRPLDGLSLDAAKAAHVGLVRIAAGVRSPPEGLRVSARHEIAYVVSGQLDVEMQSGRRAIGAGQVVVSSPTEPHAVTALTDATLLFVLIDPIT